MALFAHDAELQWTPATRAEYWVGAADEYHDLARIALAAALPFLKSGDKDTERDGREPHWQTKAPRRASQRRGAR